VIEKIVEEAKLKKCERILLNTSKMGEKLYSKFGFEHSPTAMAYYPFGIAYKDTQ
jgi:predicted N-acetyltransferase YhbS